MSLKKLACSSLPYPCVALLTLLIFFLLFFTLLPSCHFTFSPHSCTFSSLDLFIPLIFCTTFLYCSFPLFSFTPLSISNPSLLKQSHTMKCCRPNSYQMLINTLYNTITILYFLSFLQRDSASAPH